MRWNWPSRRTGADSIAAPSRPLGRPRPRGRDEARGGALGRRAWNGQCIEDQQGAQRERPVSGSRLSACPPSDSHRCSCSPPIAARGRSQILGTPASRRLRGALHSPVPTGRRRAQGRTSRPTQRSRSKQPIAARGRSQCRGDRLTGPSASKNLQGWRLLLGSSGRSPACDGICRRSTSECLLLPSSNPLGYDAGRGLAASIPSQRSLLNSVDSVLQILPASQGRLAPLTGEGPQ